MPFNNNGGTVTLTTYNDVAGNQINVYTTSAVGPVALTALRFGKPSIAPFSKFIDLLLEAQIAFQDITPLFPHHQSIRKLGGELSSICTQIALVGLLVENMYPNTWYRPRRNFGIFRAIALGVEKYTDMIQEFVDDVHLFHAGLRQTLIGPHWRRVFWSTMWHLSEGSDITRIVEQALQQLGSFQRPLNLLIDTLGDNEALHDRLVPVQSRQIFDQLLANSSKAVHRFATPRARLKLFVIEPFYSWHRLPHNFHEIDICLEYFSSFSDVQNLVNASLFLPFGKTNLVDVSNHRLITAETSKLLAASTSSLEIEQIHKVSYLSSKPMTNQCPRCDSLCNGPANGWHVCPHCYLRIRHRNYQDVGSNNTAWFDYPLFEDCRYVDWMHIDPQSLPRRLVVSIEPHLMGPLLHFMRSSPTDTLHIDMVPKSLVGIHVFPLENPRHDVIPNIKHLTLSPGYETIRLTHLPNVSLSNLEKLSIWGFGGLAFEIIVTWVLSHPSIWSLRFLPHNDLWTFSSLLQLLPGLPLLREFRFCDYLPPEELHQFYDHIQEMKLLGHPIEQLTIGHQVKHCCCWDRLHTLGVTVENKTWL